MHAFTKLDLPDFMNYLLFNAFAFYELFILALQKRVNILHSYPKSVFPAVLIAKLFRMPLVVDFRDQISVFAKEARGGIKSKFFAFCERLAVKNADHLISISEETKQYLLKLGARKGITVIPSGVNFNLFNPANIKKNVRKLWNIPEKSKLVLYSGSLDKVRECDKIIDAVALARTINTDLHLMLVGDGPGKEYLLRHGKEKLGNRFILTGFIPYQEIPDYVNSADLGVCYLRSSPNFRASSPLKLIEYLSMNKPVVATDIEPHSILSELNAGILVKPGSVKDFAVAILRQVSKNVNTREKIRSYSHSSLALRCIGAYEHAIRNFLSRQ